MDTKDKVEVLAHSVTMLAILFSSIWAYKIFVLERHNYPHAVLTQVVSHVKISDEINLVQVIVSLKNTGKSMLRVESSLHKIQQIVPLILGCTDGYECVTEEINKSFSNIEQTVDRFSWPTINRIGKSWETPLDIEPNETETLDYEFVVSSEINIVRVYNYFKNEAKGVNVGWSGAVIYEIMDK